MKIRQTVVAPVPECQVELRTIIDSQKKQKTHNGTIDNTIGSANSSGVPPCASCRQENKKCTKNCVLAPFFPAEKNQDFEAVHKVFGISNVTKMVEDLSREDGKKAVNSLIWEAKYLLQDPQLGPLGGGSNGTTNNFIRVLEAAPSTTTIKRDRVPCPSCRLQHRKCTETCVLAPFFSAEKRQDCETVLKVFGVRNVTKMVKDLGPEDGKKAMDSLMWEANCWLKNPVSGPLGELQRVSEELMFYKTQYQQVTIAQNGVLYNNMSSQPCSWNGYHNNGISFGSMLEYDIHSHGIGGGIDNSSMFNYGPLQNMEKLPPRKRTRFFDLSTTTNDE